MPKGLYSRRDAAGTLLGYERFSCAPGPAGWRYTADLLAPDGATVLGGVDVTVDDRWRVYRLELRAGGWTVRGGALGRHVTWVRAGGGEAVERSVEAAGFTGESPAFAVITARLLGLSPGGAGRLRLVSFTEPALAARTVEEGWAFTEVVEHPAETRPLPVERYEVADLATAERRVVYLAGDVVLAAPGIELEELDSPPTLV